VRNADTYKLTSKSDSRRDFSTHCFRSFGKVAREAIRRYGVSDFYFEGDGVELDPVEDLGIEAELLT